MLGIDLCFLYGSPTLNPQSFRPCNNDTATVRYPSRHQCLEPNEIAIVDLEKTEKGEL